MFKPLRSALEKRFQKYETQTTAQKDVQNTLFHAMPQTIRDVLKIGDIRYDNNKKDITLVAHHRAVANEIALMLDEIYTQANKSGIQFSRILITVE